MAKASNCFTYVVQAICGAARSLVETAGLDANALLASLPPETQQTVRAFFG